MKLKNQYKKRLTSYHLIKRCIDGCLTLNKMDIYLDEITVPIKVKEGSNTIPLRIITHSIRNYNDAFKIQKVVEEALPYFIKKFEVDKSLSYLDIIIRKSLHPIKRGKLDLIDLTK